MNLGRNKNKRINYTTCILFVKISNSTTLISTTTSSPVWGSLGNCLSFPRYDQSRWKNLFSERLSYLCRMSRNFRSWALLLLLATIWGSSFVLMKQGMHASDGTVLFSHQQVAALRMLIASTVLLPFTVKFIRKIKNFKQLGFLAIVGFCGNFIPSFLFTYAETKLSSGYAGMMNSFTPIFTLLIGAFIFKQSLTWIQLIGALIAGLGIVLLMLAGSDLSQGSGSHAIGIIIATFLYGISLNTIKHKLGDFKSIEITALAFGCVFIPALLINVFSGTLEVFQTTPKAWAGFGYICILGIVGTAFAVFIFNRLIAASSAIFASSVTYFIPIVAVFMGLFVGEQVTFLQIGAMLIVLAGVFVANYYRLIFKR